MHFHCFDGVHLAGAVIVCHVNYNGPPGNSDKLTHEDVQMNGEAVAAARLLAHGCYGVSLSRLRQMMKPYKLLEDELTLSNVFRHIKECSATGAGFAVLLSTVCSCVLSKWHLCNSTRVLLMHRGMTAA